MPFRDQRKNPFCMRNHFYNINVTRLNIQTNVGKSFLRTDFVEMLCISYKCPFREMPDAKYNNFDKPILSEANLD